MMRSSIGLRQTLIIVSFVLGMVSCSQRSIPDAARIDRQVMLVKKEYQPYYDQLELEYQQQKIDRIVYQERKARLDRLVCDRADEQLLAINTLETDYWNQMGLPTPSNFRTAGPRAENRRTNSTNFGDSTLSTVPGALTTRGSSGGILSGNP
jgi:type II secretory pathway pseudopilin PulG